MDYIGDGDTWAPGVEENEDAPRQRVAEGSVTLQLGVDVHPPLAHNARHSGGDLQQSRASIPQAREPFNVKLSHA